MEIVIGRPPAIQPARTRKSGHGGGNAIEAKVLSIRLPRRRANRSGGNADDRRNSRESSDPAGARVVVLMVPDGHKLPPNLSSGDYRVFLRFAQGK